MYYDIVVSELASADDLWWKNEENILLIMILLSSKNFSAILNPLGFSRNFSNASNTFKSDRPYVFRRITGYTHLNSLTACVCRKWMWTCAFRKLPSIYVFSYFPFGFEGRMWDLIVSVPDHCLSFYFVNRVCICENGMQVWTAWVKPSERGLQV